MNIASRPTATQTRVLGATVLALLTMSATAEQADIPYPSALDAAAVVQSSLADINREAMVIGNGDILGLLWDRGGELGIRVSKNDIWDARVDTSQDGPPMKVDVANHKWSPGGYPPSWRKPYPQPRCAAVVRIGSSPQAGASRWRCIRSGGKVNQWLRDKDAGVMAISGSAGASAGYRWDLELAQVGSPTSLKLRLSGTPGAQFYVNVLAGGRNAVVASGWRATPQEEADVVFPIPAGSKVSGIELYVMTKDGKRTENRVGRIVLEGDKEPLALPPGMPESAVQSARLDLRRAVATTGSVAVRALADRNVFVIETAKDVSLEEVQTAGVEPAECGEDAGVKWLHVKLPGDVDYAGMEYAVAVASADSQKTVAIVTSWETKGSVREAAVALARETAATDAKALIARHESQWSQFWAASGVKLDDADFQPWWYRMVYYLRCFAKPGAVPVGLFAGLASDRTPWHGDYHHNYNAWQPYWTPLAINHPELVDPWVRYMNAMLPRLKWFAKTTYDCEGAFVGISSFAFEPDPAGCKSVNQRHIAIPPYGYTLGMIGMSAQNLWFSHLYRPDKEYLEKWIYPVVREAALFYCSFAEKCQRDANGKARFGPSYSPEHGAFGVDNVPFDLAYARYTLKAAVAAAAELGRDAALAERFAKALDLLPDYPTAPDEAGNPVVVDWTGCKLGAIKVHNITVPAVPVFPGDQVTWFSPEPAQNLLRNTILHTRHRGCNSTVMFSVAKARLSMPDACEDLRRYYRPEAQPNGMFHWPMHGFYLSESVGIAGAISEFLLQSVDNVIRVFPCWPKEKDAEFTRLRAQGGFLVSACQKDGKVVKLTVTSTAGGKLRLVSPWTGKIIERNTQPGQTVDVRE